MIYLLGLLILFLLFVRLSRRKGVVAFFHPYCNAGGGGERVLWCAIRSMQQRWPSLRYVVYSGDLDASKEQILLKAKQCFGVEVEPSKVEFVFLRCRRLVEPDLYPVATMALQTLAGGILALEALIRLNPALFIDSMGVPLSLPVFRLMGGSSVVAYVHYPTISCDMIDLVARRESTYNNTGILARSPVLSKIKLGYYKLFAACYGLMGKAANLVMTNGSWTQSHIKTLWKRPDSKIVFPPCDLSSFLSIDTQAENILKKSNKVNIVSVGQIRPEKNHALQIEVLKKLTDILKSYGSELEITLTIAGGCRNDGDRQRVEQLKKQAQELGVSEKLFWKLNVPYDELLELLSESMICIHTMWNEHFGISVVEGMAAGTIMLAHNSGGPAKDIVVSKGKNKPVGYLADTADEYVEAIMQITKLSPSERAAIRLRAREAVARFGETTFEEDWTRAVNNLLVDCI